MMTNARVLCAAAVLGTLFGAGAHGADIKIGVVNVTEIAARYKKHEDLKQKSMVKLNARRAELSARRDDMGRRVEEINAMGDDEDDPKRREAVRRLETDEYTWKLDTRDLQKDMQRVSDRIRSHIYAEIEQACARVGQSEGYFLILKRFQPPQASASPEQFAEMATRNLVLYSAPEADITSRVLEILESAYGKGIKLVPGDPLEDLDAAE